MPSPCPLQECVVAPFSPFVPLSPRSRLPPPFPRIPLSPLPPFPAFPCTQHAQSHLHAKLEEADRDSRHNVRREARERKRPRVWVAVALRLAQPLDWVLQAQHRPCVGEAGRHPARYVGSRVGA
eukprot:354955-Chlamydomonas_euryale.AAC.9